VILGTSGRTVVEVLFLLPVHVQPHVATADARVILGILLIAKVHVESEAVHVKAEGFFNVTDVENWNCWTKSGVCHITNP
jgi:hypothetical protein